jgi:hypothetical protein
MSKCEDKYKIRNPLTSKCILIRGKLCQSLLKQTNPIIKFDKADVKKIQLAGYYVHQEIIPKVSQTAEVIEEDDGILTKIKKYIMKFLESTSLDNSNMIFMNSGHQKFCTVGKSKQLTTPIEKYTLDYNIVIDYAIITNKAFNFVTYLSKDEIPFENRITKIFSLYFNNYNEKKALAIFHQNFEIPEEWIISMNKYIQSLSMEDKFTILEYSFHSFDFINAYLRGNLNETKLHRLIQEHKTKPEYIFPFFIQVLKLLSKLKLSDDKLTIKITINKKTKTLLTWLKNIKTMTRTETYPIILNIQEYFPYTFWIDVMDLFTDDLKRIIDKSPPVTKTLTLYRGVKDDYFLNGKNKKYYKNNTFVSCSLNPYHSLKYIPQQCCLKRISILPGSKALLMAGLSHFHEFEVILNVDSIFYIHQKKKYSIYKNDIDGTNDLCFNTNKYPKRKVDIVDIIVSQ